MNHILSYNSTHQTGPKSKSIELLFPLFLDKFLQGYDDIKSIDQDVYILKYTHTQTYMMLSDDFINMEGHAACLSSSVGSPTAQVHN